MTFPLGSLRSGVSSEARGGERPSDAAASVRVTGRLNRHVAMQAPEPVAPTDTGVGHPARLLIGAVVWVLCFLALLSHNALDPAFTTSGQNPEPTNQIGRAHV